MQLQLSTWQEVEAYLRTSTGILLPVGSTEQHGPTGLIGTDAQTAAAVARAAGDDAGILVGPTLNVGMAQHHMAFPGTMTLRPGTMSAVVRDCVQSLAAHGFRHFLFVNGHGGNIAPLKAAINEIHTENNAAGADAPTLRCGVANWYILEPVARRAEALYGDKEGHHATAAEIALTQYLYPDHIKDAALLKGPAGTDTTFHDARDFRERFPDGRMGSDPGLATPHHGAEFLALARDAVIDQYRKLTAE